MPGMVMFRRRWSVGSDDLVLPALFLFLLHCIWWVSVSVTVLIFFLHIYFIFHLSVYLCTKIYLFFCIITSLRLAFILRLVVLSVVLFGLPYGSDQSCSVTLVDHGRGYLGILVSCLICESAIMWLSMRGSILYTQPREAVQYVLYIRLGKTRRHARCSFWGSLLKQLLLLVRIGGGGCEDYLWFQVEIWTLFILIGQILIIILLILSLSFSLSYSVGRASICCGGNCLACPILPAMLWCHCQKPGFGWVKKDIKGKGNGQVERGLLYLNVINVLIFSAGIVACNWLVIFSVCITLMCTFDPTGRTFVKLKATRRRQRNLTTYTLRYWQDLRFSISLSVSYVTCFSHRCSLDSIPCLFFSVRHRLEEGQASSWSRRLKFFMCCTRAQDTQSVSHTLTRFLSAVKVKQKGMKAEICQK